MKKPIYNCQERWEMREFDTSLNAFRKLKLAILHFQRQVLRDFSNSYIIKKILN